MDDADYREGIQNDDDADGCSRSTYRNFFRDRQAVGYQAADSSKENQSSQDHYQGINGVPEEHGQLLHHRHFHQHEPHANRDEIYNARLRRSRSRMAFRPLVKRLQNHQHYQYQRGHHEEEHEHQSSQIAAASSASKQA